MKHPIALDVTRVTVEGNEGQIAPQVLGINRATLLWSHVIYIQEVDLGDNFSGYQIAGKGSFINYAGQEIYVTDSFDELRRRLLAYLASSLTAQHITFKPSQS